MVAIGNCSLYHNITGVFSTVIKETRVSKVVSSMSSKEG